MEKMRKALAEKDALLRKRTAAQEKGAADKLKVATKGGGAAKKPAAKRVQRRARKSSKDTDDSEESSREGSESSDGLSDDDEEDAGDSEDPRKRAGDKATVAVAAIQKKGKIPSTKKGLATLNKDSDDGGGSVSDGTESVPAIKDFRWRTANRCYGYFRVKYEDEVEERQCEIKDLLYDYPEEGMRFIWEKYGCYEKVRAYVGKCAMAKHGGGKTGLIRRTCIPNFSSWEQYRLLNKWPQPGWKNASGFKMLQYQRPPVDDPMKLKRKIKSGVGGVDPSKRKQAPSDTSGVGEGSVGGDKDGARVGSEASIVDNDGGDGKDSTTLVGGSQVEPESGGGDKSPMDTTLVGDLQVKPKNGGEESGGEDKSPMDAALVGDLQVEPKSGGGDVSSSVPVVNVEVMQSVIEGMRAEGPSAEVENVVGGGGVLNDVEGKEGSEVVDGNRGGFIHTPIFKRVIESFETDESSQDSACELPKKHKWSELYSGDYVTRGDLAGGMSCVGMRDGRVCGRVFVAKALENGTHMSEDQYHPTTKNIAYYCGICNRAMCAPCYRSYQAQASPSTVRKRR